jgi:hypothetical protein
MRLPSSAGRSGALGILIMFLLLAGCGVKNSDTSRNRAGTHNSEGQSPVGSNERAKFPIHAVAHLQAVSQKGEVYVDRGPVTGTFNMTMTLTIDDATGIGTFQAAAADGSVMGKIHIVTGAISERHGEQVFVFEGSAEINRGTLAYRGIMARDLEIMGEIRTSSIFKMTLRGSAARTQ